MASRVATSVKSKPRSKPVATTKKIVPAKSGSATRGVPAPKSKTLTKPAAKPVAKPVAQTITKTTSKTASKPALATATASLSRPKSPSKSPTKASATVTKSISANVVPAPKALTVANKKTLAATAASSTPSNGKAVTAKLTNGKPVSVSAAPAAVAPAKPRRRTKGEIRTRLYWAIFNPDLKRVALYEFSQREEADKRAAKLTQTSGETHFIQKIKVIVQ
jgi:hypothetical protein